MYTQPVRRSTHVLLRRIVLWPSWLLVAGLTALFAFDIALPESLFYVPFVASLVLLGLPHGAVDHLVLLRLRHEPLKFWSLLRVLTPYLALAGLYLAVWFLAPLFAFVAFILLTWFHWGQGDLHGLLELSDARHLSHRGQRMLAVFVRGGLPMLVPLLAFPEVYSEVAAVVTGVIQPDAVTAAAWLFSAWFRVAVGVAFVALTLLYLLVGFLGAPAEGRVSWSEDALEIVLLAAFFALVHPVLAVGIYFCLWHAPRHIARLVSQDEASARALASGRVTAALKRFAWQALPTTVAAIALLLVLYLLVPFSPATLPEFTGLYLVLIAVLTLPHVWVVCLMDRVEGIWESGAP